MGNAPSSEEVKISYRRRLSKHQATSSWVHIASAHDYDEVPTKPRSGGVGRGLDDAIPTVPSFALLQAQSMSGMQRLTMSTKPPASLGHSTSAASGSYKSRPSRHSTDAFHPLRSAPVSGHARAVASMKQDDAPGNDAEKSKQLDDYCFSSPPDLSSSSSTESWRTLSSVSDTSRELPLYIRRRSLQRIPGLATRPAKEEDSGRPDLPDLPASPPPLHHPYSPSARAKGDPAPSPTTPVLDQDANDLGNSSEVGYKQLGSIKFGSLRITNGSPLSMRRGEGNMDQLAGLEGEMKDGKPSSDDAADSQQISSADPRLLDEPSELVEKLPATKPDWSVDEPLSDMHVSETIRGWQGRFSSETPRPSIETLRHRISSVIEVIDDEQLHMVRRPRSALVTADDSSSVYSDNIIPVVISDDIAAEYNHIHNDNSNGPHLSFLSFRNLIRQNRVKSYLQANSKAAVTEKPAHQRSSSKDDASIISTARTLSKSRRKLAKKNPEATLPPEPSSSNTEALEVEAPKPRPPPPRASNDQTAGERAKGHVSSNPDGQVPHVRSSNHERRAVSRMSRQKVHTLRNHSDAYQTTSDHVPALLDRTRATPRAHVNFEGHPPKKKRGPTKVQQLEQLRRSQTTDFKPLPTPKPELPQRRKPVRVPVPISTRFGTRDSQQSPRELPADTRSIFRPIPLHAARSHTMPRAARAYDDNDDAELRVLFPDNENPYVSPLSDDDHDFWPLTADASLGQRATAPRSSFQPRVVSPIRHAKSMSNIHYGNNERPSSAVTPSAHLSRAQELAERWRQQQKQKKKQSRKPSPEPARVSAFYEPIPSSRPSTASAIDDYYSSPVLFEEDRDRNLPPMVYRNGTRRGSEIAPAMWRPPFRVLHSYYSPAYRNAPIWG